VKALDRWGRPLSGETWDRVHYYGTQLLGYGYWESTTKPNLFVRGYSSATFFADLGGTRYVRIAEDSRPLFYWKLAPALDPDRAGRMIAIEGARLAPIPVRLSSMADGEHAELLIQVDREQFQRPEPTVVPAAPMATAFRYRPQLFEALDTGTGELIPSGDRTAARPYLRCPHCQVRVARAWDGGLDRYAFTHPRTHCPGSPV
jgi:hypothetical protein